MSHFALTIDRDPLQRGIFLSAARQQLSSLPGVEVQSVETGSLALAWSCGKQTPLSVFASPTAYSLLMGYAVTQAGEHLNAERLLALRETNSLEFDALDGYFVGIVASDDGALSVLCDPLGLFPIYSSVRGDSLMVASSPAGCLAHPHCPNILDARGLAGILLVNSLIEERTLIQGVRRLRAGHVLERTSEAVVRERETFRLVPEERWKERSYDSILAETEQLMRESIRRQRPPAAKSALLLSGGLDSRLMAACLSAEGVDYQPFTWGRPDDFEMRAATEVVEKLGLTLKAEEDDESPGTMLQIAQRLAQWYAIPSGVSGFGERLKGEASLATVAPYFWSGMVFDVTLGGMCVPASVPGSLNLPFEESFFKGENAWGFEPEKVKKLLAPVLDGSEVDACVEAFKQAFRIPGLSFRQTGFLATLQMRVRNHLGMVIHRLSAQAWPLLPFLERRQLQLLFNLDADYLRKRRLEMDLLRKINPKLLEVPFDTNSFRFGFLQAKKSKGQASRLRSLKDRLFGHISNLYWRYWKRAEPRRYYRLYDFDSPACRAVRQAAEPLRTSNSGVFDRETLQSLLPPATGSLPFKRPFTPGTSRRNVIGVLFWLAQQSPQVIPREAQDA